MIYRILIIVLMFATFNCCAQSNSELIVKHFNLNKSIAIEGYDPVAYFVSKKAIKGTATIIVLLHGVTYCFANKTNKELFIKSPDKYLPQYGGWCAFAMGTKGEKVEVDPDTFKIVHGKLYLFYNAFFNNTLKDWNKDEANINRKADSNWNLIFK